MTTEIKTSSLSEMKDRYIGKVGSTERDAYENELSMEILGRTIKNIRQKRRLTQEALGQLIGVQKSQISKLENGSNSATIDTIVRVFTALKAEITFSVNLMP